jgi:hypothetical protein
VGGWPPARITAEWLLVDGHLGGSIDRRPPVKTRVAGVAPTAVAGVGSQACWGGDVRRGCARSGIRVARGGRADSMRPPPFENGPAVRRGPVTSADRLLIDPISSWCITVALDVSIRGICECVEAGRGLLVDAADISPGRLASG